MSCCKFSVEEQVGVDLLRRLNVVVICTLFVLALLSVSAPETKRSAIFLSYNCISNCCSIMLMRFFVGRFSLLCWLVYAYMPDVICVCVCVI